jgi:signal transduction histidine kinase
VSAVRLGLTAKFTALATLLSIVFTGVWGVWVWERERSLLEDRLLRQGRILVTSMAIPFMNALVYEEIGVIQEGGLLDAFVADIMGQEDLVAIYAMVLDPEGRVLAHNVFSRYGELLADSVASNALGATSFLRQTVSTERGPAWDLAQPLAIHGKRWGVLRVGVSLESLYAELDALRQRILGFSLAFFLGCSAAFWIVGRSLARPLRGLASRMTTVGGSLPEPPAETQRGDEIGDLQREFGAMVTRLRDSEAQRDQATRRLLDNERLVAVGQLVAGVAHEVNNPLAAIESALHNAARASEEQRQQYLSVARQGAERARTVVAQLLDLSRSAEVQLAPESLSKLFQDAALFSKMALKRKAVKLAVQGPPPEAQLLVDRNKVQQALLNLVLNAADATGEGNTVRFSAGVADGMAELTVEDEGPGVPDELREQIFEPFFTTKPVGKGSGMGLAISRRIAEVHGGELVLAESGEGGACFRLRLPVADATGESPQ